MRSPSVAFIGTYLPRLCGIATFTHDLVTSVAANTDMPLQEHPRLRVVALHNPANSFRYASEVEFVIRQPQRRDYLEAAEFLNISPVDVVCLQHEFGIFGGEDGCYILDLLEALRKPVVTTLHTVLAEPKDGLRQVMKRVCDASTSLVVIAQKARSMLNQVYGVDPLKVNHIYHGVPDVAYLDPAYYKDQFQLEGKKVLLSFGLIGPSKGFEHAIDAVGHLVKDFPNLVYVILGATHPEVKRLHGESYRLSLQQRAERLGLKDHVIFFDRFVSDEMLLEFLLMSDFYITPYLSKDQISSGTLSFALGCGKAIVSTPYWYAEELLAENRGLLAPFGDAEQMAAQLRRLLTNEVECNQIRKRAYQFGRQMVWKESGRQYLEVFRRAAEMGVSKAVGRRALPKTLPEMRLDHLRLLTDDTGILHEAFYATPLKKGGYTTDDNARALRFAMRYYDLFQDESILPMAQTYLSFLLYAFDEESNRFHNHLSYSRQWVDETGSEDCQGRALAALADTLVLAPTESMAGTAKELFERGLQPLASFTSPRAWAWVLLGCDRYLKRFGGVREVRDLRDEMSRRLLEAFEQEATEEWVWAEADLTYDNPRLCKALILAGQVSDEEHKVNHGLRALEWLMKVQTDPAGGHLSLVGNQGWMRRGGEKPQFDQLPIEASALLSACHEALKTTGDPKWRDAMRRCFDWFLGVNDLNVPLYNFTTRGCHDGLQANGISQNQGAEATLSWLGVLLRMYEDQ